MFALKLRTLPLLAKPLQLQCRLGFHSSKSLTTGHSQISRQITQWTRDHMRRLLYSTVTPPSSSMISRSSQRMVGWWLAGCCVMVGGAVVVGGVTRLTESGLSMTQWHLVKGMKPPRSQQEWREEFERYKQFPEYKHVHQDLTLEQFKRIFYMEYLHRMWGRVTGLAIILPATFFWARGMLGPALKRRAGLYSGIVVLQGLLGWYMVKSGLKEKPEVPRVSQYRLASHLSLALILYASMFYTALGILRPVSVIREMTPALRKIRGLAHGAVGLVFFTAVSGAFVAGLDAGLVYNSFPLMGGRLVPEDAMELSPKRRNFFDNPATVQFEHRVLATVTLGIVLSTWALARGVMLPGKARLALNCFAGMGMLQVALGIATLLYYVPTPLAASHQVGALAMLSFGEWLHHELRKKAPRF